MFSSAKNLQSVIDVDCKKKLFKKGSLPRHAHRKKVLKCAKSIISPPYNNYKDTVTDLLPLWSEFNTIVAFLQSWLFRVREFEWCLVCDLFPFVCVGLELFQSNQLLIPSFYFLHFLNFEQHFFLLWYFLVYNKLVFWVVSLSVSCLKQSTLRVRWIDLMTTCNLSCNCHGSINKGCAI